MHSTLTTQSLVVQLTTQSLVHMYIVFSECPSSSLPTVLHQGHKKQQRDICERESSESVWGGEWSGGAPLAGHGAVWSECERGETRCAGSGGGGYIRFGGNDLDHLHKTLSRNVARFSLFKIVQIICSQTSTLIYVLSAHERAPTR